MLGLRAYPLSMIKKNKNSTELAMIKISKFQPTNRTCNLEKDAKY